MGGGGAIKNKQKFKLYFFNFDHKICLCLFFSKIYFLQVVCNIVKYPYKKCESNCWINEVWDTNFIIIF